MAMGGVTWRELGAGGVVRPGEAPRPRTGGWRTGVRPAVDLDRCIDCLLCWLYCPDTAVAVDAGAFAGIDLEVCKGCELCAAVCPVAAIEMVPE
jgi:2-oxoacid:acceptor oxidoreductase delta subunit (pyruvate/2-ketoisovalerate family)